MTRLPTTPLDCDGVQPVLAAYVAGELNDCDLQAVASHLGVCARCAETATGLMPAAEWFDLGATAGVPEARWRPLTPSFGQPPRQSRVSYWWAWPWALGVVVLVGLGWWLSHDGAGLPLDVIHQESARAQHSGGGSTLFAPVLDTFDGREAP